MRLYNHLRSAHLADAATAEKVVRRYSKHILDFSKRVREAAVDIE